MTKRGNPPLQKLSRFLLAAIVEMSPNVLPHYFIARQRKPTPPSTDSESESGKFVTLLSDKN